MVAAMLMLMSVGSALALPTDEQLEPVDPIEGCTFFDVTGHNLCDEFEAFWNAQGGLPVFGYALGWYAADWLEGKSVPQGLDVLPFALTAANMAQYEADQLDPGAVYDDPVRRDAYLRMFGNICYDTRDQYLNFPWSSYGQ